MDYDQSKQSKPISRKRPRVEYSVSGNGTEGVEEELLPFVLQGFYGEHKRAISSVSFSPIQNNRTSSFNSNSKHIGSILCASSSADQSAKIWDIANNVEEETVSSPLLTRMEPKSTFTGHSKGINDVCWSPSAEYVATASDDRTLRLWDVQTGDAYVEFK